MPPEEGEPIYRVRSGRVEVFSVTEVDERPDEVLVKYECEDPTWNDHVRKIKSADPLKDIKESKSLFFDRHEAEKARACKDDRKKEREQKLNGDYIACSYCDELVLEDKAYESLVYSGQYQDNSKKFRYCSKECADYDQMAHEG